MRPEADEQGAMQAAESDEGELGVAEVGTVSHIRPYLVSW